jgi:tRNA pseudouridine55 synthase
MVRGVLGVRRVGHTGTLDPFATGLLVVLVGRATRLARFLMGLPKRYSGVIRLGVATNTLDHTGATVATTDTWRELNDGMIVQAMESLTGQQRQQPPVYSAKKVQGEAAHRRVRRGETVELQDQDVVVHSFDLVGRSGQDLTFDANVGGGTYLRALARDLGEHLGCGAHLTELRRTEVGRFNVAEAVPPDQVEPTMVQRPAAAVEHLRSLVVGEEERERLRHGQAIDQADEGGGPVALLCGDELLAVAEPEGRQLKPRVVLVD